MTEPTHTVGGFYEWAVKCDICNRARSAGGHKKCSKLRQALRRKEKEAGR